MDQQSLSTLYLTMQDIFLHYYQQLTYKPIDYTSFINHYFQGHTPVFSSTLPAGTDFQHKVWLACLAIPYGQTWSYSDIAQYIQHPHAYRAVGSALNKNPWPILIPCHRVIKNNGVLGHYALGADTKAWLIHFESIKKTPSFTN
jgi:O-6-methylguanine DNA methyltransferase